MVNRRQRYCHSLGAAIVAGALAITTLAGTTNEANQGAVTANHGAAADPHAAHKKMVSKNNLRRSFAIYPYQDLTVTDMGGDESTLGDQIGNQRAVILHFIFTTCTTICPVQAATFAQVQRQLGEHARDVTMISVSIDPEYDTPERLRKYSAQFNAGPQWQFVTGSASEMITVQRAFDAYNGAKMNHRPLTLIKPPGDTQWLRLEGLPSAAYIVSELQSMMGST